MSNPFGRPFRLMNDTELPAAAQLSPADYAAWVKLQLATLKLGDEGLLRIRHPQPTAAFSPQDTTHPNYERVKQQARANGFEPIERGTGGRLTMFDQRALAITIISPHANPHEHTIRRYELLSAAIALALSKLGIDARIGELPNEYCPGKFSINAESRIKLVGVAQRMNRRCIQMGAIIAVTRSEPALSAIAEAYAAMALPFDPSTYGAIRDLQPGLTAAQVQTTVIEQVTSALA